MTGPEWARWMFALLFGCLGVGCLACWVKTVQASRGADPAREPICPMDTSAHVLMAAGMVVMFLPAATSIPPLWWAVAFGLHSLWLAARTLRKTRTTSGQPAGWPLGARRAEGLHLGGHTLAGAVMAFMFAVMPPNALSGVGQVHAGHLATNTVVAIVGWSSAAYFLAYGLRCGIRVATASSRIAAPRGTHTELSLRMVMGVGMSYMLLTML
ncbi:MAG: DUF5134 domain-containing protein [Pseudonocardia sp.]|nr:DUF5134 domain-containing protein [Pseudonocardia sp.]